MSVQRTLHNHFNQALLFLLSMLALLLVPQTMRADAQRRDSTTHKTLTTELRLQAQRELPDMRHRMLSSAQPVEIRQQGRYLCVTSRHAQLLPVYSASGTLYSSFRLSKGTNWLNGLPRGSYFINNRKFTIN